MVVGIVPPIHPDPRRLVDHHRRLGRRLGCRRSGVRLVERRPMRQPAAVFAAAFWIVLVAGVAWFGWLG